MTPKEAENKLKDYLTGKLEIQKKRRKNEILYPVRPRREELGVKVQTTQTNDRMEREIISYLDDSRYNEIVTDIGTLERFISYLRRSDYYSYQILILFYVEGKTWVSVANKVPFSDSTCRKKRDRVLEELVEWFK